MTMGRRKSLTTPFKFFSHLYFRLLIHLVEETKNMHALRKDGGTTERHLTLFHSYFLSDQGHVLTQAFKPRWTAAVTLLSFHGHRVTAFCITMPLRMPWMLLTT